MNLTAYYRLVVYKEDKTIHKFFASKKSLNNYIKRHELMDGIDCKIYDTKYLMPGVDYVLDNETMIRTGKFGGVNL